MRAAFSEARAQFTMELLPFRMNKSLTENVARILVIEDNPADARLIREGFTEARSSAEIMVAADGESALDVLTHPADRRSLPDLILLDLNLPGKGGHEILKELKDAAQLRRIPVIVITSSMSERDIDTAYDCGASLYVRKPSDLEEFYKLMESIDTLYLRRANLPSRAAIHSVC
jgi:CheY-like chemotaxis protein